MTQKTSYNLGYKVTALGFVVLVLSGNLWMARALLGGVTGVGIQIAAWTGVGLVALGGVMLGISLVKKICQKP